MGSFPMRALMLFAALPILFGLAACNDGAGSAASGSPHGGGLVEEGRKLYVGRCTACHAPEPVRDYTRAEWTSLLPEMAEEARLNARQSAALRAYVYSQL